MKQELEQLTKSLGVFEKLEHGKCLQKKKKKKYFSSLLNKCKRGT
jgi:hypothetical protein